MDLKIKKVERTAQLPTRAHADDAGLDLRAFIPSGSYTLEGGKLHLFRTGIAVAIPQGHVGLLCPRSGLAVEGIMLTNSPGVIDAGYTGEVKVNLINASPYYHNIHHGDRIAQLVIVPIVVPDPVEVDELDETERGDGSHGSSGR